MYFPLEYSLLWGKKTHLSPIKDNYTSSGYILSTQWFLLLDFMKLLLKRWQQIPPLAVP